MRISMLSISLLLAISACDTTTTDVDPSHEELAMQAAEVLEIEDAAVVWVDSEQEAEDAAHGDAVGGLVTEAPDPQELSCWISGIDDDCVICAHFRPSGCSPSVMVCADGYATTMC